MNAPRNFIELFTRYGRIIFSHFGLVSFLVFSIVILYTIMTIQQILTTPSDQSYKDKATQQNSSTSFDKATIDAIRQLRTTKDQTPPTTPSGRYNPFVGE